MNVKLALPKWLPATARPAARPGRRDRRRKAVRSLAAGVVATAALFVGLGVAAERSLYVRDPAYADKEVRLRRLEAAAPPGAVRVVALGTSRTGYGFHGLRVGDALNADLGRPAAAFNFGVPASGPVTHLLYLRRLLDAGHTPDLLFVEILPPSLAALPEGPREQLFLNGERLRRDEAETAVGYGFDADKTRGSWRRSVLNPWSTLRFALVGRVAPSFLPWQFRQDWGRNVDAAGWCTPLNPDLSPARREKAFAQAKIEYEGLLQTMTVAGGRPDAALRDLLTLTRERGIPVRLLLMPESDAFRGMYAPAVAARLDGYLAGVCREFGCGLVDARPWLPADLFTDGHHMVKAGAEAFSDRLTREVIAPFFRPAAAP